ncbi:uncharacterized protein [Rutidosis leptorrhynchoides]|uniref:uncharacterized protein n=1 Tax=Rutidosis leptorrhynchoides TaxID=125765 RepID=UPI003A99EFD6
MEHQCMCCDSVHVTSPALDEYKTWSGLSPSLSKNTAFFANVSTSLKELNFWVVFIPSNPSWGWKKLLSLRDDLRGKFLNEIGKGVNTVSWFNEWNEIDPLILLVRRKDILTACLSMSDQLTYITHNGPRRWIAGWMNRFFILSNLAPPAISSVTDIVPWYLIVRNSHSIPRDAFVLWLLLGERLKTPDKLQTWEIQNVEVLKCSLCNIVADSHDHIFFSCNFSSQVWAFGAQHMDFPIVAQGWRDFTIVICKLLFGA